MKKTLAALAIFALVWALYAQTAGFAILACDDLCYISICPFVQGGLTWENVRTAFFGEFCWGGIWMPITSVTYMAIISLFGKDAAGPQHLVGVLFHSVNAVLFFILLVRIGRGRILLPFLAATLWALHPLRAESVAWIASRKDTIFTFFLLLGLISWHQALSVAERGKHALLVFASYFAMACSCMSKPTAMCFPLLALCVEYLSPDTDARCRTLRANLCGKLKYVPLFVMATATGFLAAFSQSHVVGGDLELYYGSLTWRLTNAAVALGMQLYHTILPRGLNYFYRPIYDGLPMNTALGLSVLAIATALVYWAFSRRTDWRKQIFWCGFWFMASIGPTLGIAASFGHQAYADRFTYVPMMAFSLLLVTCAPTCGRLARQLSVVAAIAALSYSAVSMWYIGTFRDDASVFARVLDCDEMNSDAWRGLGGALFIRTKDPGVAIPYFRKAIEVNPEDKAGLDLLYMLRQRNTPEDKKEFEQLVAQFREEPLLDQDGLVLDMLVADTLAAKDYAEARRYLEAMARVTNAQFAAKAKKLLSQLPSPTKTGPFVR